MVEVKLNAPLDASSVLVMPEIDLAKSGIVAIIVDGVASILASTPAFQPISKNYLRT
jgi:hypothetical protein